MTQLQIGLLIRDIGTSQKAFDAIRESAPYNVTFFCEQIMRPVTDILKPIYDVVDAFTFRGPLISTCLSTTKKLLNMPAVGGRWFYVYDLEWVARPGHYADYFPYWSDRLQLVARGIDYKRILENNFNRKCSAVCRSFAELYEYINGKAVPVESNVYMLPKYKYDKQRQ